jgi:diketogulonate reductase-like aldo/keto reductase
MPSTFPNDTARLRGGGNMPLLGFGTWQLRGDEAFAAVTCALEVGYRHLDTATIYGNEAEVGRAIAKSGLDRDTLFVTTKVPPNRSAQEPQTLAASLDKLGTDRVDLWLIHWASDTLSDRDLWRALIHARDAAQAKAIGVSNYSLAQIDELERATGVLPAVNQIKWSPLLFDRTVLEGHRDRGVVLEGYSALRGGTLDHPVIRRVAESHDASPAQVIIRWHLQHEVVVIPKSAKHERIRSNAEVAGLELSEDEMAELDSLSQHG